MLLEEVPNPADQQVHRALLSSAIASGEGLLLDADASGDSLQPLHLTPAAIYAKLESLRITFEQWHTDINPQRQAAVLREVFGGEA